MKRSARSQNGVLSSKRASVGIDSTTLLRKHGVWIFPLLMLSLTLVMRALAMGSGRVMLGVSAASMIAGAVFRKQRRAAVVVFVWFVVTAFASLVLLGILFPLAGLRLTDHAEWIAPSALAGTVFFLVVIGIRTRTAFLAEFSQGLESVPGVYVGSEGVFRHELHPREHPFLGPVTWGALGVLTITLLVSYGTKHYLAIVLGVCPIFAALFCVDPVARVVSLFVAILRWERSHGKRLYLPPLSSA